MRNRRKLILALSWLCVVLFFWIIYPKKWFKRLSFRIAREEAIAKAEHMHYESGKRYVVVQNGRRFYVGRPKDFKHQDTKIKRELNDNHCGFLKWDYRNAIIYKTK